MLKLGIELMERGLLPGWLVQQGVRSVVRERFNEIARMTPEERYEISNRFLEQLRRSPVALVPEKANEQHYEVPAAFFQQVLGKHLKYSSCYFESPNSSLDEAEATMLSLCAERAELQDGMRVLELGCGWGSFSLWIAEHFPNSQVVGVSNSSSQRAFIEERARERGLANLRIITADMNEFSISERFDRVVSVEMFEHMRNYRELLSRISSWMVPGGKLFVHIFCHRTWAYPYETDGPSNWMGRYFFTGGIMPSEELLYHFQEHLQIESHWRVNGRHYEKTARAWMALQKKNQAKVIEALTSVYGSREAKRWYQRWMVFFLSCAELFGFRDGEEWFVAHYLFKKPA
jgi:cyclopropane-fatty-acyl-phospholipid synthase